MDIFEVDEQQREEELQKWWHDNWKSIVSGIVVALLVIIGVHQYREYEIAQKQENTIAFYTQVLSSDGTDEKAIAKVKEFIAEHQDNFGVLAGIQLAKTYVSLGKYEDAYNTLNALAGVGQDKILDDLLSIRIARLAIELKNFTQAQSLLDKVTNENFVNTINELKGDLAFAQGDKVKAYEYYGKALDARTKGATGSLDTLKLKRNSLATTQGAKNPYFEKSHVTTEATEPAKTEKVEVQAE